MIIFMSLFPSYSPISFSQKEPVPSNWIILFKVLENLRFLQESLSSTILYHLIWFMPHLSFSFPFLWHPWFCMTFSSCFLKPFFFSPFHFLFFVIVPSYIDVGIPMFYSHPQAVSWLCSWGISNSPMISTKQLSSYSSTYQAWSTIVHSADVLFK